MKKTIIIFFIIYSCCLLIYPQSNLLFASDGSTESVMNYLKLRKIYSKWKEGLFGSRKYNERLLKEFLHNLIYKEIKTDYSYAFASPYGARDRDIKCRFSYCQWLIFHGKIDLKGLEKILNNDKTAIKRWWRSKKLLSVSGKVMKFRLGRNRYGDTVEIYLEKIVLSLPE